MAVAETVADDVCAMLKELQGHGGILFSIGMNWQIDHWSVEVKVVGAPGDTIKDHSCMVAVETFDVALAVATAVGGRYDLLKSDDTRAAL